MKTMSEDVEDWVVEGNSPDARVWEIVLELQPRKFYAITVCAYTSAGQKGVGGGKNCPTWTTFTISARGRLSRLALV